MTAISLKLPEGLRARLEAAAKVRGRTKSEVVRAALEMFLSGKTPSSGAGSCLDLARDLAGAIEGPGDLAGARKHLRGYGK